jgi:hypothetical protein
LYSNNRNSDWLALMTARPGAFELKISDAAPRIMPRPPHRTRDKATHCNLNPHSPMLDVPIDDDLSLPSPKVIFMLGDVPPQATQERPMTDSARGRYIGKCIGEPPGCSMGRVVVGNADAEKTSYASIHCARYGDYCFECGCH